MRRSLTRLCTQAGDELVWVQRCTQGCSLLIGSSMGMVAHFPTSDELLRPQARSGACCVHALCCQI